MENDGKTKNSSEKSLRNRKKNKIVDEEPILSKEDRGNEQETNSEENSNGHIDDKPKIEKKNGILPNFEVPEVDQDNETFKINVKFDLMSILLFILASATRFYKLSEPNNIV
jgi:hypothetical protein